MGSSACKIGQLEGEVVDPYSSDGKETLSKAGCSASQLKGGQGVSFIVGNKMTSDVMVAKGYFTLKRTFDEGKDDWSNELTPVRSFDSERILLSSGRGKQGTSLLITPEKGERLARTLDKIKILNEA
jgi:hypothetical protein